MQKSPTDFCPPGDMAANASLDKEMLRPILESLENLTSHLAFVGDNSLTTIQEDSVDDGEKHVLNVRRRSSIESILDVYLNLGDAEDYNEDDVENEQNDKQTDLVNAQSGKFGVRKFFGRRTKQQQLQNERDSKTQTRSPTVNALQVDDIKYTSQYIRSTYEFQQMANIYGWYSMNFQLTETEEEEMKKLFPHEWDDETSNSTNFSNSSATDQSSADNSNTIPRNVRTILDENVNPSNMSIFDNSRTSDISFETAKGASKPLLLYATPIKLIEYLTTSIDQEFVVDFFLIFRAIMTPIQLLSFLILRFRWALNENDDDHKVVRIRFFVVLRYWLTNFWVHDFYPSVALRSTLFQFMIEAESLTKNLSETDRRIISNLNELIMRQEADSRQNITQPELVEYELHQMQFSAPEVQEAPSLPPRARKFSFGNRRIKSDAPPPEETFRRAASALSQIRTSLDTDQPDLYFQSFRKLSSDTMYEEGDNSTQSNRSGSRRSSNSSDTLRYPSLSSRSDKSNGTLTNTSEYETTGNGSMQNWSLKMAVNLQNLRRRVPTLYNSLASFIAGDTGLRGNHRASGSHFTQSILLNYSSEDIVRQFCILEQRTIMSVSWMELLDVEIWQNEKQRKLTDSQVNNSPNETQNQGILALIDRFNLTCAWVASEILNTRDIDERAKVIAKMIRIAQKCYVLHNYSTLMEIVLGLQNPLVERLKQTWAKLTSQELSAFNKLTDFTCPLGNFRNIRIRLHKLAEEVGPERWSGRGTVTEADAGVTAAIPFTGLFLSDLVFNSLQPDLKIASDAPSDSLAKNINFNKFNITAQIVRRFRSFQSPLRTYSFPQELSIYGLVMFLRVSPSEELERLSHLWEPRI